MASELPQGCAPVGRWVDFWWPADVWCLAQCWCKAQRCPVSLALPLVLTGVGMGGASWLGGVPLGRVGIYMATGHHATGQGGHLYGHWASMPLGSIGNALCLAYSHWASMPLGKVGIFMTTRHRATGQGGHFSGHWALGWIVNAQCLWPLALAT